ncbi:hypothetical protein LCGC14_0971330 [marine sediment metagenome]|uniref:Helicase HerA central domain-containing protein n=1 Tax=marine sediment metagenome TaxID=412755 RepID=A0A0F9NG21_9ZZZZ
MEKEHKSVSRLLDKGFGSIGIRYGGTRGIVIHEAYSKYYKKIFKTPDRSNKMNYRIFSKRLTKAKADVLADIKMNPDFEVYHEDNQVLLDTLHKEIRQVGKALAKDNYNIIIPKEVEIKLFGGEASFEVETIGKIRGLQIPARIDCLIEIDLDTFTVRDFKSYEREKDDDPLNPESQHHRGFMQICLYAIICEKEFYQNCTSIELAFFPNNIVSYDFTEDLKEQAKKFAIDTAFEGFEGIVLDIAVEEVKDENVASSNKTTIDPDVLPSQPSLKTQEVGEGVIDKDSLGWINTTSVKPFKIIRGKPNKIDGYLYPKAAEKVRENSLLKIVTNENTVLGCKVEKIECFEESASTVTKTHKEENYKITLNPEIELTPEGCCEVRPQTIISGKIKKLLIQEYYQYKKIPQNGMSFGNIEGLIDKTPYLLNPNILYQSCFIGGVQNTGKTSTLRYLIMLLAQQQNAPTQIIFDVEEEYLNMLNIPTSQESLRVLEKVGLKSLNPKKFNVISFNNESRNCLTLKAIDPLKLPLFLYELTSITHSTLQRIIKDIISKNKDRNFSFPELKEKILKYVDFKEYKLNPQTKSAIERALMPISLDLFDRINGIPINIESILEPGKITIIDCFESSDEEQRLIALFLLCAFHKYKMKKRNNEYGSGILFYLDEVHRLLPKLLSNSDNQKRIIHYLGEIHHRGRKRKYGVIYATQSPLDVKKEILDLCNSKLFFQIQGDASNLLKEYLNKEERERLKQLPTGHAYITSMRKHEPVEIKFPYLD